MAKVEVEVDIHENSLDNSADSDLLGMVDEGSFGSADCERSHLVPQSFLDANEEDNSSSYNFKDLSIGCPLLKVGLPYRPPERLVQSSLHPTASGDFPQVVCPSLERSSDAALTAGAVTYKLVQMTGEETPNTMSSHSPTHVIPSGEFYVISNPVQVFGTTATQKKVIRRQPLQNKAITAKKRDDKRRATHNEVERRRRDKINSWITKLAALVPNSGLPDTASKGGILAKACDHITELTEKQKKLEKLEVDNDKLVLEVLRLNQELTELRKENSSMRLQLADNCIITSTPNHRPKGQKS